MALNTADQNSAPPGYTSQRDVASLLQSLESRSNGSTDELVSAQSHPQVSPLVDSPVSRHSDVHFNRASPTRTNTDRRMSRYASLPYDSPLTVPLHLQYTDDGTMPTNNRPVSEYTPDSPKTTSLTSKPSLRLNPTNYVSLSRKSTPHKRFLSIYRASTSITGPFTVNPYLHIPAALLSPISNRDSEAARKNLRLEVENGGIDVDIYLVGEPSHDTASALRTTLDLKIRGGAKNRFPLIAKLHTPGLLRPPFYLCASAIDGYLSLHLPASFHGLVSVKVIVGDLDPHISLSPGFSKNSTILSETATTRSYFVGELGGWSKHKQSWEGDKIDVTVGEGRIRLQILGEKDWDKFRQLSWKISL